MPPKRSNPSASSKDGPPAKKPATKKTAPRLKKSTTPDWEENPEWSQEKPTSEWAKKCVERWCLLPPYDTSIKEKQWETYYNERSALDKVNSSGADESKPIVSEELDQDTWVILRKAAGNVAAAILGSSLDDADHKKQIAYTLMGSLYFTDLWGNDEGDGSPREVSAKTRLYSPFGIGTSIDFFYSYHYRTRMFGAGERFSSLYVKSKTIDECNAKEPRACTAFELNSHHVEKAAPDAVTIFDRAIRGGGESKGTTAANIKSFEEPLFGCEGWLSPLKLANLLLAAATVLSYNEADRTTAKSAVEKFQFFQGESDGKSALTPELARLANLEKADPVATGGETEEKFEVCIPQRMLLLARQEGKSDD
ncbi:hypothetical protein BDV93DRAFT_610504 [Ceratobasidium sp. AG-I]|nr:hypothetical protein BDV93DRAFT_610504 [Ceratobasidium sp. AG-I]